MEGDEDDGEHDPGVRAKYLEENAVEEWTFNSRNGTISSFSSSFYLLKTSIFLILLRMLGLPGVLVDVAPPHPEHRVGRVHQVGAHRGRVRVLVVVTGAGAHTGVVNQLKCSCLHLILI